jgi:hypothetical protein
MTTHHDAATSSAVRALAGLTSASVAADAGLSGSTIERSERIGGVSGVSGGGASSGALRATGGFDWRLAGEPEGQPEY